MKVPILIPNIFNYPFTYDSNLKLKVGDYVVVPFGKFELIGVVWDQFEKKTNKNFVIKRVSRKLDIPSLKKKYYKIFKLVLRIQHDSQRYGFKAAIIKWQCYRKHFR
jgi:primosomal protein N'